MGEADALVVIPSDPLQTKRRLYDHAKHLGSFLSKRLKIPRLDLLNRSAFISSQKELSREDRLWVLRQTLNKNLMAQRFRRLLLVDDILTTGASILRAAELLAPLCDELGVYCIARTLARRGQFKDK